MGKSYLTQYREKLSKLAHLITGEFLADDKIRCFEETRLTNGIKFEVYFADDGLYLDVEIKVLPIP